MQPRQEAAIAAGWSPSLILQRIFHSCIGKALARLSAQVGSWIIFTLIKILDSLVRPISTRVGLAAALFLVAILESHPFGLSIEGRAGLFIGNYSTLIAFLASAALLGSVASQIVRKILNVSPGKSNGLPYMLADPEALFLTASMHTFHVPNITIDSNIAIESAINDA